jgi:hypothetical protein
MLVKLIKSTIYINNVITQQLFAVAINSLPTSQKCLIALLKKQCNYNDNCFLLPKGWLCCQPLLIVFMQLILEAFVFNDHTKHIG